MYDTTNYTLHSVNCNSIPTTKPTTNDNQTHIIVRHDYCVVY